MNEHNGAKPTNFEILTQLDYLPEETLVQILKSRWESKQIILYVYCNNNFQQSMNNKMMQEVKWRIGGAISLRRCEGAKANIHR